MVGPNHFGELTPLRRNLEREDLGRTGRLAELDGSKADRSGAIDGNIGPWTETAGSLEDRVVGNARRFGGSGNVPCQLLISVALEDRIDTPAKLNRNDDVFGHGPINRESKLLEIGAMVGIPVAARATISAPDHFLDGDPISDLESFRFRPWTDFDNLSRELVPQYRRELSQSWIENIVLGPGPISTISPENSCPNIDGNLVSPG